MISKKKIIIIAALVLFTAESAFAQMGFGRQADGGELMGMNEMCTCSGGTTIQVKSYIDQTRHIYLYSPYITQLKMNYNIMSSSGYFLTTLNQFQMCLIYVGESCENANEMPEGTFLIVGTSFRDGTKYMSSLVKDLPASELIRDSVSNIKKTFSGESKII